MFRKIANTYRWFLKNILKNGERNLRDAFDKNIKIQEINKGNIEFVPEKRGIRISALKKEPKQSAQSSRLFYR